MRPFWKKMLSCAMVCLSDRGCSRTDRMSRLEGKGCV